jgi:hypothetical protein
MTGAAGGGAGHQHHTVAWLRERVAVVEAERQAVPTRQSLAEAGLTLPPRRCPSGHEERPEWTALGAQVWTPLSIRVRPSALLSGLPVRKEHITSGSTVVSDLQKLGSAQR